MTDRDERGHRWEMVEPAPDDLCLDCQTPRRLADGIGCNAWTEQSLLRKVGLASAARVRDQDQFESWWSDTEKWLRDTFEADLARLRSKAEEYGGHDLAIMGTAMEGLIPPGDLNEEDRLRAGTEMAFGFYVLGKAARLFGAWSKGTEPGDDSWRDLGIYAYMARRVREHGKWM